MRARPFLVLLLALVATAPPAVARETSACEKDVDFALEALEEKCGLFFELKDIDWKKVAKQFRKEAKKVDTPGEHYKLLVRLTARLKDGHAGVRKIGDGESIEWPDPIPERMAGPGLFLCRVGKKVYVKNAFSTAQEVGIGPGWEVVKIEDQKALDWLEQRIEERRDTIGFSTDHHAFADVCTWGLAKGRGERLELELKDTKRKKRKRTITLDKATCRPWGPLNPPAGYQGDGEIRYGKTPGGYGYIHLRKCPRNLPQRVDEALAAIGDVDGLILDLRANGGGGYDHEGLMGRFVPPGKTLAFKKRYESAGPAPYGGPVVVIVDGQTLSAGETTAAIFKEDGRAYVIGECPTSGMSSSKTTIELPSGLFALYVSIHSNMSRSNGGRGIEGIGIPPHEIVAYDPEDLAEGRDTLLLRAEALLAKYPRGKVPYDPRDFGWRR